MGKQIENTVQNWTVTGSISSNSSSSNGGGGGGSSSSSSSSSSTGGGGVASLTLNLSTRS